MCATFRLAPQRPGMCYTFSLPPSLLDSEPSWKSQWHHRGGRSMRQKEPGPLETPQSRAMTWPSLLRQEDQLCCLKYCILGSEAPKDKQNS